MFSCFVRISFELIIFYKKQGAFPNKGRNYLEQITTLYVCVCVRERERKGEKESERESERERARANRIDE